jgi:hypothetical protein
MQHAQCHFLWPTNNRFSQASPVEVGAHDVVLQQVLQCIVQHAEQIVVAVRQRCCKVPAVAGTVLTVFSNASAKQPINRK